MVGRALKARVVRDREREREIFENSILGLGFGAQGFGVKWAFASLTLKGNLHSGAY